MQNRVAKYEVTGFEMVDFSPGAETSLGVDAVLLATEQRFEALCTVTVMSNGDWGIEVTAVYDEAGEKLTKTPLGLDFELALACEDASVSWDFAVNERP